jgi:hypothetical protein
MKIAQISAEFEFFFNRFRDLFSLRQYHYFRIYVYSLIITAPEHKNVNRMSQAWVEPVCRSSPERFLCGMKWEFEKVIRRAGKQIMNIISQRKKSGRRLFPVIDDTTPAKSGQKIFGVGRYKKNRNSPAVAGLQVVIPGVSEEGWLIPIDFRIYVKEEECEYIRMEFETKLRQASEMLKKIRIPHGYACEVMFDTWYLNEQVTETIRIRGWTWISRCADNRSLLWEGEKKRQNLRTYISEIKWQNLKYETDRKRPAVAGHQRIGHLKKTGRVKMVISSLLAGGNGRYAFFCTNNTRLPMVNVISRFENRWKIEVFFKETRKCFGFSRWQCRDIVSVVHHLCLTIVAAIACACIRLRESEGGKSVGFESWGEFTDRLRKKNQRLFPEYFSEQSEKEKYSDFDKLCSDLGI